jgi:hypothetical protein
VDVFLLASPRMLLSVLNFKVLRKVKSNMVMVQNISV